MHAICVGLRVLLATSGSYSCIERDQDGVRLAFLDCSDHPCKRTSGCMRDDTQHCRRVVPNLPNIMSCERLGTQSRGATSRLLIFPFYEWTQRYRDRLQRLRASFVDREWTLADGLCVRCQTGIPHPRMSNASQKA